MFGHRCSRSNFLSSSFRWLENALCFAEANQQHGIPLSRDQAYHLLQECMKCKNMVLARRVHVLMVYSGLDSISVLADNLIRLFALLGGLIEASQIFCKVSKPSCYTWNALIDAHVKLGTIEIGLHLFHKMHFDETKSDKCTFSCILKACGSMRDIGQGRIIHEQVIGRILYSDIIIVNTILDMYIKAGSLEEAIMMYNKLEEFDLISCNIMIAGYAQYGKSDLALKHFEEMSQQHIIPDKVTYLGIFKACAGLPAIEQGRKIHEHLIGNEFLLDVVVSNALVDMYAKCQRLQEARSVFDRLLNHRDVVSWNSMIAGYAQHEEACLAVQCFDYMDRHCIKPNKVTFLSMLKACASTSTIYLGRQMHERIVHDGLLDDVVVGSSLVDMYAKCCSLTEAQGVFDRLAYRNVVSWGAMISGYVQHGQALRALEFYQSMQCEGIKPDEVVFSSILKACGSIGALDLGRRIHEQITQSKVQYNVVVGSALVDLYSKCGSLRDANRVFKVMPNRDVVSWSAMVAGYAQGDEVGLAVECFEDMQRSGLKPNDIAFIGIFTAFSHAGLVDEGTWYFRTMSEYHDLSIEAIHVSCMIDLLGHAGRLKEAENFLETNKNCIMSPSWMSLLSACNMHCNIELGEYCFDAIVP